MKPLSKFISMRLIKNRPGLALIFLYMSVVLVGGLTLWLPFASKTSVNFVDCLFTAASAITVTGLNTVPMEQTWTFFGYTTILILIQLGGLGIMSLTTLSFLSSARGSLSIESLLFQEVAGGDKVMNARELVKRIAILTLAFEAVGAIFLFFDLSRLMPPGEALGSAIFHSVSAFCNAGFTLSNDSFMRFSSDGYFLGICSFLIVLGGLGFLTLSELWDRVRGRHKAQRMSLHVRVVLLMTAILIGAGAALLYSTGEMTFLNSLFHSITPRTAGFNSVDMRMIGLPAIVLTMLLMFIGASPGSTGGGIKVTTVATLASLGFQRFGGEKTVTLMHRSLPTPLVIRAVAAIFIGAGTVGLTALLLVILQGDAAETTPHLLRDIIFESFSAVSTVGLSLGLTEKLTVGGKFTLIFAMIIGRLGVLTVAYGIAARSRPEKIRYAEGTIMVG